MSAPSESLFRRLLAWDQMNPPMTGDHAYWKREIESALAALRPTAPQPAPEPCKGGLCDQVFIGEPACEPGECWAKECAARPSPTSSAPAEPPAGFVTIHIDVHDRLDCCRRLLEMIAVGDVLDAQHAAKEELVAHGFWNDPALASSVPPEEPTSAEAEADWDANRNDDETQDWRGRT